MSRKLAIALGLVLAIAPALYTVNPEPAQAAASVKSVLSPTGQSAYNAASSGTYFEVSASDYSAAFSNLSNVTKVGTTDANIAACSYSWSPNYGTVMNNSVILPANAYILGFASGFYTAPSTTAIIRLISSSTYKGTYNWFSSDSVSSTGQGAKYYLFKTPSTSASTRYLGHWSSGGPCATAGSYPTGGYFYSITGPWSISNTYTSDIPNLQVMYTTVDQWVTTATVSNALAGNVTTVQKGIPIAITSSLSDDGLVTFKYNNKNIGGCVSVRSSSLSATCNWKPSVQGSGKITATLRSPTAAFTSVTSPALHVSVIKRGNNR